MLRTTSAALLTTLTIGTTLYGCADNESSLFIQGVLAIGSSDCVARPDAEAEMLSQGVLDTEFADGYVAVLQVGNQLTQQGNREKLRTETSRLRIEGVSGSIFDTSGAEHEFEAIATGFVDSASGTDPGLAAVSVNLISTEMMGTLRATEPGIIVARFHVFGTTLGGQEIESADFDYPIYVCGGCLIDYPPEALDTVNRDPGDPYLCGASSDAGTATKICYYGQDQRFSCTACATVDPICRDPLQNPWNRP